MTLFIKNMVCNRCRMAVQAELEKAGLHPLTVELGEVELGVTPSRRQLEEIDAALKKLGFELIDDKRSRIIAKMKKVIIELVHHSEDKLTVKLSERLSQALHYDYSYLSNLFSEVEGTTIEKYFISQRIERAKELLVYDELSLSEIADRLGYSGVAHLSAQFKKVTGLTPTYYKSLKQHRRRNIDEL